MQPKLSDFSPSAVIPAIEESLREYWVNLSRAPQCERYENLGYLRVYTATPIAFLNGASSYQLSPDQLEKAITDTIQFFQARRAAWEWVVGPKPSPPSLLEALAKHGFEAGGSSHGMAIQLTRLDPALSPPSGLEIIPVENDSQLKTWVSTAVDGFEVPDFIDNFVSLECSLGCQPNYRRYLAFLHGKPVATSTLYLGKNVAGIYTVATIPSARKLGIGAAVTLRALLEAQREEYSIAVLQASPMGRPVYLKLGFQEFSTLTGYSLPAE